jgi:6-phosphogluconolactonase
MEKEQLVFVGTYTQPIKFGTGEILYGKGKGIDILKFDPQTGYINYLTTEEGIVNPSYIAFSKSKEYLYAVNELKEYEGEATGTVSAFKINQKTGKLSFINLQKTGGTDPCHVNVSTNDTHVFVSNFMSGSVSVFPISINGGLGEAAQFIQHEGSSVNTKRQNGPHAHSLIFDKNYEYAFVPDLGIDMLMVYKTDFDKGASILTPQKSVKVFPGMGPRHCEFDASYHHCYLINELASSISVFNYDGNGAFELKQTISTLAEAYEGDNICADIHLTPNGKFLYGSNRGHNSIAIYSVDEASGMLTYITSSSCGGKTPRNFAIDPSGRFLLVANQDSDNIVSFAINENDATLSEVMHLNSPTPVCIKFF